MEFLWETFAASGSVEAYLGYKEFEKIENRGQAPQTLSIRVNQRERCQ